MALRYFAQVPPSHAATAELQLLGRLANARGLTDTPWPFALLPGVRPAAPQPQEPHAQTEATEPG